MCIRIISRLILFVHFILLSGLARDANCVSECVCVYNKDLPEADGVHFDAQYVAEHENSPGQEH